MTTQSTSRPSAEHAKVLDRLFTLASERFARSKSELSAQDDLFEALDIDSMEALSLLTALEEAFNVEIPDYEVQDVRTFADLAGVVARRL